MTTASFDRKDKTLTLSFSYNTPVKAIDGDGKEIEDPGEYNVTYIFDILDNRQIKFRRVWLAG